MGGGHQESEGSQASRPLTAEEQLAYSRKFMDYIAALYPSYASWTPYGGKLNIDQIQYQSPKYMQASEFYTQPTYANTQNQSRQPVVFRLPR